MKRFSLIVLVFLGLGNFLVAQDNPIFNFGVKAGVNLNFLQGSFEESYEQDGIKFGGVGGVFFRINLPGSNFFIQPEILVSQVGSSATGEALIFGEFEEPAIQSISGSIEQLTLDVPVLAGYRIGTKSLGLRINLGPYFSAVLDSKFKNDFILLNGGERDASDIVNSIQVGIVGGIGLDLSRLNIDLRYQGSFTDVFEDNLNNGFDPRNGTFQATVGFKIL